MALNVVITKGRDLVNGPDHFSVNLEKLQLLNVRDKNILTTLIVSKGYLQSADPLKLFYHRKSKKSKKYVRLETEEDFRILSRSLKVKNTVHLQVEDDTAYHSVPGVEVQRNSVDLGSIDFGKMANALVEAAIEHFKEIIQELSTSKQHTHMTSDTSCGEYSKISHEAASCDRCSPTAYKPIVGVRYRCLQCVDFDLCGECEANVQRSKERVGEHEHDHTMVKIIRPEGRFDIPRLREPCTLDMSVNHFEPHEISIIKNFLESPVSRDVIMNYRKLLEDSTRYQELVSAIKCGADEEPEIRHAKLLSLLSRVPLEEATKTTASGDVHFSKKDFASNTSLLTVTLANSTSEPVGGGDLEFRFTSALRPPESFWVKNTAVILPGRTKRFNLPSLPPGFDNQSDVHLTVFADSCKIMENPFNLKSSPTFELEKSTSGADVPSDKMSKSKDSLLLRAKLSPISSNMSLVQISNHLTEIIDCNDILLKVVNCFGKTVCETLVHKLHEIRPGRAAKFNIPLSSGHMKYPFELSFTNKELTAVWQLNQKRLVGDFALSSDRQQIILVQDPSDLWASDKIYSNLRRGLESNSASEASSATSLVILPNVPKETLDDSKSSASEFEDAATSLMDSNQARQVEDLSDYDIISIDDEAAEDDELNQITSDFEVLSTVTSQL